MSPWQLLKIVPETYIVDIEFAVVVVGGGGVQSHFFVKPNFGLCMVKLWLSWGFDNNDHISASIPLSEMGL